MADVRDLVGELHEHLVATGEQPVEPEAARWLGEAEAVAADVAGEDVTDPVTDRRIGQVRELLADVGETDSLQAVGHVEAVCELLDAIERALEP